VPSPPQEALSSTSAFAAAVSSVSPASMVTLFFAGKNVTFGILLLLK
jgi:hypothetical protein